MADEFPEAEPADAAEIARHEAGLRVLERLRGELDDDLLDLATDALRLRIHDLRAGTPHGAKRVGQCSVLFVDVVGSTPLGGKLDPEAMHLVMDAALERFTQLIRRHGGRVMQFAGDSVMGAWGVERAREDDAAQAVACGLALTHDARLLADRIRRRHAHAGFGVRVGVHTGPVLLGGGVEGDNTIRGGTVNLAARMEQNAPTGTVRITAATQRHVAGQFELEAQPPLQVKGYAEPQATWLVRRRLPARAAVSRRGVHGVATPLVGRDAALAALQQAWSAWQAAGGVHAVALHGEAGLGKTRLLAEWQAWAQARPEPARWLMVQAWPAFAERPQALLQALLGAVLDLPEGEPPELARERFLAVALPQLADLGPHAEAEAQVLGHLIGLNFAGAPALQGILQQGGQLRQRGWHAARTLLRAWARAQGRPVVLVLDDLHWADAASLQFLRELPALAEAPPLLLVQARRDAPPGDEPAVVLQPLAEPEARVLAAALLAPLPEVPPGWTDALVARAAGNPFALEELVQVLLEQGTLVAEPETEAGPRWRLGPRPFDPAVLPATLVGVLQARLVGLPPPAARTLRCAAVLGEAFALEALAALQALEGADPEAGLPELEARGLVQPRGLAEAGAYAFASPLLRQLVEEQLLQADRQVLHRQAGRWLLARDQPERLPEAAEHLEQGGEPEAAAQAALAAAEHFAARSAQGAVVRQAGRALRLLPEHERAARWRALKLRQRARRLEGQAAHAEDLDAMEALARRTGDPVQQALVAFRRMVAAGESGQARQAVEAYPWVLAAVQAAGDPELEAMAQAAGAAALRATGRHAEAQAAAEAGLAVARRAALVLQEAELLLALAAIATERGDPAASRPLLEQALAAQREIGDLFGECVTLINLGVADLQQGALDAAEARFDGALALAARVGHRLFEVSIRLNRSTTRQEAGRPGPAQDDAEAAVALARALGNPEYEAFSLLALAGALEGLGRGPEAEAACERSEALLEGLGQPHLALEPRALRAALRAAAGDAAAARALLAPVLHALHERGHLDGCERPLRMRLQCIQVLQAAGEAEAARAELGAARQALCDQAGRLPAGEVREGFLQGHPQHRALQALAVAAGLASG